MGMMVVVLILGYGSWSDGRGSWPDGPMVTVRFLGRCFDHGCGHCRGLWFLVVFLGRTGGSGWWLVATMVSGCGGCGMGGGFLVGDWVLCFVVTIGFVVAGGAENSWVEEKERDRGERGRIKNNKERIFK